MDEVDLQQRIPRVPAAGFAHGDLAWIEPGQRAACLQMSVDEGGEAVLIEQAPDKLGVFGLLVGPAEASQVSDMGAEFIDHVQAGRLSGEVLITTCGLAGAPVITLGESAISCMADTTVRSVLPALGRTTSPDRSRTTP
ncbi:hypothetical protein [Streptomyces aurantiogriseus]|nr:hypothetical protein [Streptomyces aurantiogriseus]